MLQVGYGAAPASGWAAFRSAGWGLGLSSDTLDGGGDAEDDGTDDDLTTGMDAPDAGDNGTGDDLTPGVDAPDAEPAASPDDVPALTPVRSVLTPRQG